MFLQRTENLRRYQNVRLSPFFNQIHLRKGKSFDDKFLYRGKNFNLGPEFSYKRVFNINSLRLHGLFSGRLIHNQTIVSSIDKQEDLIYYTLTEERRCQLNFEEKESYQIEAEAAVKNGYIGIRARKEFDEDRLSSDLKTSLNFDFIKNSLTTEVGLIFENEPSLEEGNKKNREKIDKGGFLVASLKYSFKSEYDSFLQELQEIGNLQFNSLLKGYLGTFYKPSKFNLDFSITLNFFKRISEESKINRGRSFKSKKDSEGETITVFEPSIGCPNDKDSRRRFNHFRMLSKFSHEDDSYYSDSVKEKEYQNIPPVFGEGFLNLAFNINLFIGVVGFPIIIFFNPFTKECTLSVDQTLEVNRLRRIQPQFINLTWVKNQLEKLI